MTGSRMPPVHPAAELFPLIEGPAFDELVADIAAHGLRHPVDLTPDGQLLDGRNRWRACDRLGITPETREVAAEPWAYVMSSNRYRRHLTASQRAMIAAEYATRSGGGRPLKTSPTGEVSMPPTEVQAAALLDVGARTVAKAKRIKREAPPEVAALVRDGTVSTNWADRVVRLPADEQEEVMTKIRNGAAPETVLPPEEHTRPVRSAHMTNHHPNRHRYVTVAAVTQAIHNLEALELRIDNASYGLDPAITAGEAHELLTALSRHGGAYRALRRLLTDREKGKTP